MSWMDDYKEFKVYDAENLDRFETVHETNAYDAAESVARGWVEDFYSYSDYGEEFEYGTIVNGQYISVCFSVEWEPSFSTSSEKSNPDQFVVADWEALRAVSPEIGPLIVEVENE